MSYSPEQLISKLSQYRKEPVETEWLEFKEAKQSFEFENLGKYFSAISNEANLKKRPCGWLILGVQDKPPRNIPGTLYKSEKTSLEKLKHDISQHTNGISFQEIYELFIENKRVLMFQIPSAPANIPTAWKGHYFGREGESLIALSIIKLETIRSQVSQQDWSAQICPKACEYDLDDTALKIARNKFRQKNKDSARFGLSEIDSWDTITFLEKIQLARQGHLTHATILLLGKPESAHHLSPHPAQITWKLDAEEKAYEHFGPPFLLAVEEVFKHIRNVKFRFQPFNQLVPVELTKYDSKIMLEALNNCIVHQDYTQNARIIVTEKIDKIIMKNSGGFYDGTVEEYVLRERTPERYRNPLLAQAMVQLDMIDTLGMGIRRMFIEQRKRFFPLPEYELSEINHVTMTIYGRLIDENYSRVLMEKEDLSLEEVIWLDQAQKKKKLAKEVVKNLRKKKLIEGRYPDIYLSSGIHKHLENKAEYIKQRGMDKGYYENLIAEFLHKFGSASRKDIDDLLLDKLPGVLSHEKKRNKIRNLLHEMSKKKGIINNAGTDRHPKWELSS